MNAEISGLLVLVVAGFVVLWISPNLLGWCAAKMLARRDAIRSQKMALAWYVKRFEEEL